MVVINTLFTALCIILVIGLKHVHKECISQSDTMTKILFYVLLIPAASYTIYLMIENWVALYNLYNILN